MKTPPAIPRQRTRKRDREREREREREGRRRAGARLAPAIHYTGLLGQPVLHRAPGTPNRKTGRRRPTEEHYFRRSRQNGWLGTRVRESQMTCACVRLTTSTEVVHRNHKDRRGASWQPRRTPKGNKLTSLLKEPALLLREPAQSQMPILSNPESRDQSESETDEHPFHFKPNE